MSDEITTVGGLIEELRALETTFACFDGIEDSDHDDAIRAEQMYAILDRFRPDRPVGVSAQQIEDVARAEFPLAFGVENGSFPAAEHACARVKRIAEALSRPSAVVDAGRVEAAYREAWADFEANPKSKIAFGRMDALAAVLNAFTSGVITLNPGKDDDERCPACLGANGVHGLIHKRFAQGGGGTNKPCPRDPAALGLTVTGETK